MPSYGGDDRELFVFYTNSVSPSSFDNFYELYAIAAAVLVGCSLRGGEGSILGIVLGTALLQVLQNLVNILGIPNSLNFAVMGTVILLGVLADQQLQTRRRRKAALAVAGVTGADRSTDIFASTATPADKDTVQGREMSPHRFSSLLWVVRGSRYAMMSRRPARVATATIGAFLPCLQDLASGRGQDADFVRRNETARFASGRSIDQSVRASAKDSAMTGNLTSDLIRSRASEMLSHRV
jgi:Branched-chain amino acid transport system / permease component